MEREQVDIFFDLKKKKKGLKYVKAKSPQVKIDKK